MNSVRLTVCLIASFVAAPAASAQVVLTGTSYTENFNALGTSGLPTGWAVYTGATTTGLGTVAEFATGTISWGDSGGAFKNVAAPTELNSESSPGNQTSSADRALGIRTTGSFGDPGAAFVFHFDSTGVEAISISFEALMLKSETRSHTWTLDYSTDGGATWSVITTWTDPGTFGSSVVTSSGSLPGMAHRPSVFLRFAALTASTGSGSRDTIAIDDIELLYTAVPEPATYATLVGAALLGFAVAFRRRTIAPTSASAPPISA